MQQIEAATAANFKGTTKAQTLEMLQFLGENIQPLKGHHYTHLRKLIAPAVAKYTQRLADELTAQQEAPAPQNKKRKQCPKLTPALDELNNDLEMKSSTILIKSGVLVRFKNYPMETPVEEVMNGLRSQIEDKLNDKVNTYRKLKTNISVRVIHK